MKIERVKLLSALKHCAKIGDALEKIYGVAVSCQYLTPEEAAPDQRECFEAHQQKVAQQEKEINQKKDERDPIANAALQILGGKIVS